MKPKLSDLWRLNGTIDRGAYFFWGLVLMALKLNIDRVIGRVWFQKSWEFFRVETLELYLWQSFGSGKDELYLLALLAASLPFVWVGTVLTLRRLRSLGWKPWLVLLFFVPVVKLVFFVLLCILPARPEKRERESGVDPRRGSAFPGALIPRSGWGSAVMAGLITVALATGAAWLSTSVLRGYGWSLFVGLPFLMGFLTVLLYSYHEERSLGECLRLVLVTVVVAGTALLLLAMEGLICIMMAAPIVCLLCVAGAAVGYLVQKTFWWRDDSPGLFCVPILMIPLAMGLEHRAPPPLPLLEVKSSVIVNAPPEKVWRNVVSFAELPPPREWIFKLGIAYPVRAEIHGHGVGAVRHCNFSTGPFVEPIEVWDEPRLLKFSVTSNPEPMQEWTPYRSVHPPHLDGHLESKAGQFRLVRLADGRTLLEGTTWYHHRLWPATYWQVWSDQIIRAIHLRVLNHVKTLSEDPTL